MLRSKDEIAFCILKKEPGESNYDYYYWELFSDYLKLSLKSSLQYNLLKM